MQAPHEKQLINVARLRFCVGKGVADLSGQQFLKLLHQNRATCLVTESYHLSADAGETGTLFAGKKCFR